MDRRAVLGCFLFISADHGERERGIALLLGERRQHREAVVLDGEVRLALLAVVVTHRDPMLTLGRLLVQRCDDRLGAVIRPPVDTAAHKKVRAKLVRRDEQLIDVALAIADMDAPCRIGDKRR